MADENIQRDAAGQPLGEPTTDVASVLSGLTGEQAKKLAAATGTDISKISNFAPASAGTRDASGQLVDVVRNPEAVKQRAEAVKAQAEAQKAVNEAEQVPEGELAADVAVDEFAELKAARAQQAVDEQLQAAQQMQILDESEEAIQESLLEEMAAGEQEATELNKIGREMQLKATAQNIKVDEQQARIETELTKLNDKFEELSNETIDPNKYINNMSTGTKILGVIASIMGGAGSPGNPAIEILQRNIDQDIAAQKANLSNRIGSVKSQQGVLNQMQSLFKDQRMAEEASRAFMLDQVKLKTQAFAARTGNAKAKQRAAQLIAGIEQQKLQVMTKFKHKITENIQPTEAELQGKVNLAGLERLVSDRKKLQELRGRAIVNPSTGKFFFANSKEGARELGKKFADSEASIAALERMLGAINNKSKFSLEDRATVTTELTGLIGKLRVPLTGPGILTEKEYERLLTTVGNPNKLFSLPTIERAKIQTLINKFNSDAESDAALNGIQGFRLRPGNNFKTLKRN